MDSLRTLVVLAVIAMIAAAGACSNRRGLSAIQEAARACGGCHGGAAPDGIYATWLRSPYSDPRAGVSCQGCHSAVGLPDCCAPEIPESTDDSPRGRVPAARLGLDAWRTPDGGLEVEALVANTGTGHLLPASERTELEVRVVIGSPGGAVGDESTRTFSKKHTSSAESETEREAAKDDPIGPFATEVSRFTFDAVGPGPIDVSAELVLVGQGLDPLTVDHAVTNLEEEER